MKIYSFWSGDTTFFTTSKSLKNAQKIGREIMQHYITTCQYLGEEPQVGKEYFIPEEVCSEEIEWFVYVMQTDVDTVILDEKLYNLLK